MDLTPFLDDLHEQLARAADAGGDDVRALAERLASTLDSAARLALLDALSAAAADITQELAPGSVEVRLRGREPEFVVTLPPAPVDDVAAAVEQVGPVTDDTATARINLRLPQDLKDRVDDAARAEGVSVNTWLVRAASSSLARTTTGSPSAASRSQSFSGWVR